MEYEFLTSSDKPALLAIRTPFTVETANAALVTLGYKVHNALNHGDFVARFTRVQYHVIVIEELFDAASLSQNLTLQNLQALPMQQRRHAVAVLVGDSFQTLSPMQAFCHSVHAVVNRVDLESLAQIVQQVVADNEMFLTTYRDCTLRIALGKS